MKMTRARELIGGAIVALAVASHGLAKDKGAPTGLGKAKDVLGKEFKDQRLQLRVDVLAPVRGNGQLSTTATPAGVTYPNHDQPRVLSALSFVEVDSFRAFQDIGAVSILLRRPGYKPHAWLNGMASMAEAGTIHDGETDARVKAEAEANLVQVLLKADDAPSLRAALARVVYLDGTTPSDDDLRRCLRRASAQDSDELAASRCGISADRARALRETP